MKLIMSDETNTDQKEIKRTMKRQLKYNVSWIQGEPDNSITNE